MTTIAKDFAAKLLVAFVAVAMAVSAFAPAAQAQTTEELQAMINDLLAQVATLQGSTGQGGTSVASGICPYTWTRDLSTGSTGADVMKLQQFLNADADTRVAAEGAGSVGMETEYFGPATAAAVSKMQVKYRAEILSPAGLVNPTGYFGPSSRAVANSKCTGDMTDDTTTDEDDEDMTDEDDEDMSLSGEASLDVFEVNSADDDQVEEGAEDAPIAELTVEFADGDAEISRLDITIKQTGVDTWDVLETVSLWVDGDMVAEMDAADEDDYLDEDDGTLRFAGLDIVAMEDEELDIVVGATFQNNVDNTDLGSFDVSVEALRFFDADGVASTEDAAPVTDDTTSFTLEEAGFEDEVIVKTSTNDPDATTLQLEDDSKSDWYNVFVFDLDTDDSINDIELNTVVVEVLLGTSSLTAVLDDAELVIDGTTVDDYDVVYSTTTNAGDTGTLTFDVDGDVVIDAGERVGAELMLRFKALAAGNEGITIEASVDGTTVDADGADDVTGEGSATGDEHTLRTTGIDVSPEATSATVTTGDNAGDDYATFEVEVEVTAFEQDVRISTNVATSIVSKIVDGAGTVVSGTSTRVLTSSADENGGYFEINEGETETITLQVTFDSASTNAAARLVLESIRFDETGTLTTADDQVQVTTPETDYRTAVVTIVN